MCILIDILLIICVFKGIYCVFDSVSMNVL